MKFADGGAGVLAPPRDQCWFNLECAGGSIAVECEGARCTCTLDVVMAGVKPATLPVEVPGACADSGEKVLLERCLPWAPDVARSWPRRTPSARWGGADAGKPSEPGRPATPVVLPSAWTACRTDAECTFVSLGCCDTTPVHRAHAADAQRKLDESGRPFCAPKTACAPTRGGTWAGEPGRCRGGVCAPVD